MPDQGHDQLLDDLTILLAMAKDYRFHDFKNIQYPDPKTQLIIALEALIIKVKSGRYDN